MSKTNGKVVTKKAIVTALNTLWDSYERWLELGIIKEDEKNSRQTALIGVATEFKVLREFIKA